jgi:hypothetical protein
VESLPLYIMAVSYLPARAVVCELACVDVNEDIRT